MSKEQNKFGNLIDEATKTPRTDKATFTAGLVDIYIEVVDANFARQLEAELADAKAKLRKLSRKNRRAVQTARHFANRSRGACEIKKAENDPNESDGI